MSSKSVRKYRCRIKCPGKREIKKLVTDLLKGVFTHASKTGTGIQFVEGCAGCKKPESVAKLAY